MSIIPALVATSISRNSTRGGGGSPNPDDKGPPWWVIVLIFLGVFAFFGGALTLLALALR
jgi:hypothetical protein